MFIQEPHLVELSSILSMKKIGKFIWNHQPWFLLYINTNIFQYTIFLFWTTWGHEICSSAKWQWCLRQVMMMILCCHGVPHFQQNIQDKTLTPLTGMPAFQTGKQSPPQSGNISFSTSFIKSSGHRIMSFKQRNICALTTNSGAQENASAV